MVLFARLELKQTQKLVITPQLQQAIKLLQLSALELQNYLDNELRDNPLLVEQHTSEGDAPSLASEFSAGGSEGDVPAFDSGSEISAEANGWDADYDHEGAALAEIKSEHQAVASDWLVGDGAVRRGDGGEDYDPFATLAEPVSLKAHLSGQAHIAFASIQDRFIADYIIDLIEPDGYLRRDFSEIASALDVPVEEIERIVLTMQTFDPAGICATSLAECLAIQLKERNRLDPLMQKFLDHLDLVAAHDFNKLRRVCGVDAEDLEDMIADIRRLDPRPGLAFQSTPVETLIPDVIVKRSRDGTWHAELNPAASPSVAVDRAYYNALKSRCRSDKDRAYLSERFSSANWLAKSLEQRLATILKVANAVVEEQSAFFDKGVRHLKPLNLRQIAEKIGMHESTVSRVTSNKAMATPRGLLEMKYFFTSAISGAGAVDKMHSSEAVRDRIKELISREKADQVLSDDRIVTLLRSDGIDIARRTVAKYREALRIPSSSARRRQKRTSHAA